MANVHRQTNLHSGVDSVLCEASDADEENLLLTEAELRQELCKREGVMQQGGVPGGAATGRWRVYVEAGAVLSNTKKTLRLFL